MGVFPSREAAPAAPVGAAPVGAAPVEEVRAAAPARLKEAVGCFAKAHNKRAAASAAPKEEEAAPKEGAAPTKKRARPRAPRNRDDDEAVERVLPVSATVHFQVR